MPTLRIAIAAPSALVRAGIADGLAAEGGFDVVGAAATLAELAAAGVQAQPPLPGGLADPRAALIELATPGEPSDFRLGLHNFWVLTRYNRSALYAAAVSDLADSLRATRPGSQEPGR